jgi:hypothetical protein
MGLRVMVKLVLVYSGVEVRCLSEDGIVVGLTSRLQSTSRKPRESFWWGQIEAFRKTAQLDLPFFLTCASGHGNSDGIR